MRFGQPFGSGFGDPQNLVAKIRAGKTVQGDMFAYITPATNFGNRYYQLYINNKQLSTFYLPEGEETAVKIPQSTNPYIAVLGVGQLNNPNFSMVAVARTMEINCPRATLTWQWLPEALGTLDNTHLTWSAISLAISQTHNCPVKKTWRGLDVAMTVTGSAVSVVVSNLGTTICTGTGTLSHTVWLYDAEHNIKMAVDVDGSAVTYSGEVLVRFPSSMQIKRNLTNPATTVVDTVLNLMTDDIATYSDTTDLTSGTYYYATAPVSDTNTVGSTWQVGNIVVPTPLPQPTGLAYKSGNADDGMVVGFGIATPWDNYIGFVSPVDGTLSTYSGFSGFSGFSGYTGSSLWYSGEGSLPSEAFGGYPGTYASLVRSYSGAYRSENINSLDIIVMADGSVSDLAPNVAGLNPQSVLISAGLTLHCTGTYQYQYEPFGHATTMILAARTPTGTYNWASPIDTQTLAIYDVALATVDFTYTFAATGNYYIACRAVTAGGAMGEISSEIQIEVSNSTLYAYNATIVQARG